MYNKILLLIFLFFLSINIYSQSIIISGSDKSSSGESLLGINVFEKDSNAMEQVSIGFGTQPKEAVTGSVASIKGDKVREVLSPDITRALQGQIAGVQLSQTSTKPGSSMQIRIRGTRSLYASNDPLIVLDGIPFVGTISDINTDDICSIDILKDAAAAAIYGSRGANGVILITTNKVVKGQKIQVSYNGYYGVKNAIKYSMMNAAEFIKLRSAAGIFTNNGMDESNNTDTDWQDLFYRTGTVTNHNIGVSGGTKKGYYKFNIGYYKDEAVIPLSDYSRLSLNGSIDQEIGKYLRFGFSTNSNYNITNGADLGTYGALSMSPLANPRNTDGTWKRTIKMQIDEQWTYSREIIENLGDKYKNQTKAYGSYNTVYGEVKIPGIEGLKYRVNISANYIERNFDSYTGVGVFSTYAYIPSYTSNGESKIINSTTENMLSYDHLFTSKHRLNVIAMYSSENTTNNVVKKSYRDIALNSYDSTHIMSGLNSIVGRAMYSYDDRYMISITLCSDASLKSALTNLHQTSPAASIGWNIMKESFMKNINTIDAMKLRIGYGQTSNQFIKNYGPNEVFVTSYYPLAIPNPTGSNNLLVTYLKLEYSTTKNVGLDFSILKGRLKGTAEYFVTDSKDIFLNLNLPVGSVNKVKNEATTLNRGLELTLNGILLDNMNGWSWDASVNIYSNQNKITSLVSGYLKDEGNSLFVGHSINSVYDYKKIGIWQHKDSVQQGLYEPGTNSVAGMIRVEYTGTFDSKGNPTRAIGAADRQVYDLDPLFQGGFNTRVTYKGFDLSIMGNFQCGGTLISTLYGPTGYLNMMTGRRGNMKLDYWTPTNTDAKYPNPASTRSGDFVKYASLMSYFDASYVKIRTITLGYNFTQKWLKNICVNKLRLYLTAQNPLVLFSPYYSETGMDPETNSYGNENQASANNTPRRILVIGTNTPATKNFIMGVNLIF